MLALFGELFHCKSIAGRAEPKGHQRVQPRSLFP
jgi:hypothetical protein